MKKIIRIPCISIILIVLPVLFSFIPGDTNSEYNVPVGAYSVCASDIDLDNHQDLIIGHAEHDSTHTTITIMKNRSNGHFEITDTSKTFAGLQHTILAVDVNHDTYPDIISLYTRSNRKYIRVFYNSKGTFQNYTDFTLNCIENIANIMYGDMDADGHPDILVALYPSHSWGILYNDGHGNFTSPEYHEVFNNWLSDLACGDLNKDGRDDVVAFGSNEVNIFYNYAAGFEEVALCENQPYGKICDFNLDGMNDIACYNSNGFTSFTIITFFERTITGNYFQHSARDFHFISYEFHLSDFNNDGLKDLFFQLNNETGYVIYYNKGNFGFGDSTFVPVAYYYEERRNCCFADLDGNGFNDIVTVRTSSTTLPSNIDIKFNDGAGHFVDHPLAVLDKKSDHMKGILRVFPNPVTDQACIEVVLPAKEIVTLSIYNAKGNLVATLLENRMTTCNQQVFWNRHDRYGEVCESGIYLVVLKTLSKGTITQKIIVNK